MEKILNYQASLFGNFTEIKANTTTLNTYTVSFPSFLPSVINLAAFDIRTNSIKNDNRLQLITNDQLYSINFLPDRIDICYNWNPMSIAETDIKKLSDNILDYVRRLYNILSSKSGIRIATSCNILSNESSVQEMDTIISKYSSPKNFFEQENNTFEWSIRYNAQFNMNFDSKTELTNHIVNIERLPKKNQFVVLFDINTDPQNQLQRFSFSDLEKFSNEANTKIQEYIKKFEYD